MPARIRTRQHDTRLTHESATPIDREEFQVRKNGRLANGRHLFSSESVSMGHQVTNQVISVIVTYVLAIVGSFVILKVIDAVIGLRVSADEETRGLDVTLHNEEGYIFQ